MKRASALSIALVASLLLPTVRVPTSGWYLMGPPTEADIDSSCHAGGWPTWRDLRAAVHYGESISDAQMLRCMRESLRKAPKAPLSEWVRIEIPKGGGLAGEWVSEFEKLQDCEAAADVAHNSQAARRGAGTRFVPPKEPDPFSACADDFSKEILMDDESGWRRSFKEYKRKHSNDDRALTFAASIDRIGIEDLQERNAICFANDDPRLAK